MSNHSNSSVSSRFLEGHFMDMDQQLDTAKLGMWAFLMTEILYFGGLFAAYIIYRILYPELFAMGAQHLITFAGATNTLVLIASSVSVAFAIRSAQLNQKKNVIINLCITIFLAFCFLVIKGYSWFTEFSEGLYPGRYYTFEGIAHPKAHIFFSLYYLMTGLHALHVIIGIGLMLWLLKRALNEDFGSDYFVPLEICGLYWHFVDLIWIFLFPLFYLIS